MWWAKRFFLQIEVNRVSLMAWRHLHRSTISIFNVFWRIKLIHIWVMYFRGSWKGQILILHDTTIFCQQIYFFTNIFLKSRINNDTQILSRYPLFRSLNPEWSNYEAGDFSISFSARKNALPFSHLFEYSQGVPEIRTTPHVFIFSYLTVMRNLFRSVFPKKCMKQFSGSLTFLVNT